MGNIKVNGAAFTGAWANGLHVNAYLGDVNTSGASQGVINGLDVATANTVATGTATGFASYPLVDPAIVGDPAADISVDAGDVSTLAAFTSHFPTPTMPNAFMAITAGQGGSLVNIAFHVLLGVSVAASPVSKTAAEDLGLSASPDRLKGGETAVVAIGPGSLIATVAVGSGLNEASAATVFQIGGLPLLNTLLYLNSPLRLAADRMFAARAADSLADQNWFDGISQICEDEFMPAQAARIFFQFAENMDALQ